MLFVEASLGMDRQTDTDRQTDMFPHCACVLRVMNQKPVIIYYIPVEVVVSGGGSSVVVGSGRCAASSVTAAEDPVSLSPEVGEEDVSVMATADLVAM